MSKPVEIEFLMRDKISDGMDKVGKGAVSMGEQIAQTSEQIQKKIKEQKDLIKYTEGELGKLEKAFKKVAPGREWMEQKAEIEACKKALEEDKAALAILEQQHGQTAESGKRLSKQYRDLTEQMAQMRLEGQQHTPQYEELRQKAALLADTLGDVRTEANILAHDNAGLQGLMSGVNGVAGAFTAATGVMGLFAGQNADLMKIQARVQSVMAISIGLQQVLNTLNKDSAFRIVTLTKAKTLFATANTRLAVSLGITNVAAKALMVTLTGGLSIAIGAAIMLWDRYKDKQAQAKQEAEDFAKKVSDSSGSVISDFRKMIVEWEKLGDSLEEKKKYVENNQEAFDKLGVKIRDVADAENLLINNRDAFLQSIMLKAKAAATMEAASEKYKLSVEKMTQAEGMDEMKKVTRYVYGTFKSYMVKNTERADLIDEASRLEDEAATLILKSIGFTEEQMKVMAEAGIGAAEEIVKGSVADIENIIATKRRALKDLTNPDEYATALKEIQAYEKQLKAITGERENKSTKSTPTNTLGDLELKAQQKIEQMALAIRAEGYDKQRDLARQRFEEEKARIRKEEKERLELYDKLKKAGVDVTPEQRATITAQADSQAILAAQILDKDLADIDTKENKDRQETLQKLLEPYRDFAQQRLDIETKFNKDIQDLQDNTSTNRLAKIGKEMAELFGNGNVDLLARPMIDAAKLVEKGWEDAGEGIATVFSSQFGVEDKDGKVVEILVTPILPNGDVLTEAELEDYVDNVLNGAEDLLAADTLGILISVGVDETGNAGDRLHELQEAYYDLKNSVEENVQLDDQIARALVVAEEEKNQALEDLDMTFAQKEVAFQALMSHLGNMSIKELETALEQAEEALKASEITSQGNPQQLASLRAKVAAIRNELKLAKAEAEINAPSEEEKWRRNSRAINKCKQEVDGIIDSMDFLDESTSQALKACSNIAGGAIAMIDGIKLLGLGAAESISAVEKASVILAIVGAAVKIMTAIFSMASAAEKRHQEALAEIQAAKIRYQREYNLLLLQQNLLMEQATTIFGEQQILKAANAVEVYRQAIADYKSELQGSKPTMTMWERMTNDAMGSYAKRMKDYQDGIGALAQASIVTGHKKTGLFGWGKGKDLYSSILSVYPDLIDQNGRLNTGMAETILNTHKMDDSTKDLIQSLINLQNQADEAMEQLRDYLQDTFGGLGDGIMDSITDAIVNKGTSAWETFGQSGAKVLEDLGKQLTYSLFFADKFAKLQTQLEAIYGSGKSEKEIANDAMNLVGNFYNGIGSQMEAAQSFMEEWQRKASQYGFDLWANDEATTQKGKSGAFETMTQDQASELKGLFTSVQMHLATLVDKIVNEGADYHTIIQHLVDISENTAKTAKELGFIKEELLSIKTNGLKMK